MEKYLIINILKIPSSCFFKSSQAHLYFLIWLILFRPQWRSEWGENRLKMRPKDDDHYSCCWEQAEEDEETEAAFIVWEALRPRVMGLRVNRTKAIY